MVVKFRDSSKYWRQNDNGWREAKKVDQVLDETKDETPALTKASMHNKEYDIEKINDILDFCEK